MEDLRKKSAGGTKLSKAETARYNELKKKEEYVGHSNGLGDLWGMSKERFAEIYAKGNSRFEASHYRKQRDSYVKNDKARQAALKAHEKDPKKNKAPKDTVLATSGIGDFDISTKGQEKIAKDGNYDILADISTSYGAGQVMGGYASSDLWQGRSAKAERLQPITLEDGTTYTPTFDDVKNSGREHDPDRKDLMIQMSLVKMGLAKPGMDPKGEGLGATPNNDQYIRMYNGHEKGDDVYEQYDRSLNTNGPLYQDEKKKLLAKP